MHVVRTILLHVLARILRSAKPSRVPRRILVIKPDHIGDLLLLTPALRRLRQTFPTAHIALMIGPWSSAAVRGNPDFDALLLCEFPGFTRRAKPGFFQPYLVLFRTALLVRAGHYDAAIIARDDHWWGALLALCARIPCRIGYAARDVAPLLSDALPYDPAEHVTRQALLLVDRLAVTSGIVQSPPDNWTDLRQVAPIRASDREWASLWLMARGIADQHPLVAIQPGAGGVAKLWLAERWTSVANDLVARGCTLVITGGPDEAALVRQVCLGMTGVVHTIVGEATLGQLAAVFERCDLVLGVDSGPLHLAAATGVQTIVLFGPGDHQRFGPWGPPERHHIVRAGFWCSPCGVLGACPRGTKPSECMTNLSVSQVVSVARLAAEPQMNQPPPRTDSPL